jgi:hypothetical protein
MLERKNIDRVFQENLRDLDIYPSKKVWNNIELYLTERPKKRTIPLWNRLGGVAIAFLLFFMGGVWNYNLNSDKVPNAVSEITDTNSEISNFNEIVTSNGENVITQNNATNVVVVEGDGVTRDSGSTVFIKKPNNVIITTTDITSIYETIDNKYVINKSDFLQTLKSNDNSLSNINPIDVEDEIKKPMRNRWSVGTTVAPVYYNTLQSGSPISEDLVNNSKVSDNALSVGVKLNYQITNKFNVQSGVNKVELAYITKDVNATSTGSKISSNNISKSGIILSNAGNQSNDVQNSSNAQSKSSISGELNQSIEYFELPIEMKYNLLESRFGIGLVGGFSTYFLTKNTVTINSQNQITDLGGASNLNNMNFSGNLGVDFDYKINKNWYLNVAPMFKYQFNTYSNNSGNFQPYYFGIYSGLNYRF